MREGVTRFMGSDKTQKRHLRCGGFSGTLEDVACPLCPVPPEPTLIFRNSDGVGIWQCSGCGIQYASPRFTEESLSAIYENPAFADFSLFDHWSYERWKRENKDKSYLTQCLKVQVLRRFMQEGERVLDVGCGTGLFCFEAGLQGLDAEGIDPSRMLVEAGRKALNVRLHQGSIEEFAPSCMYGGVVVWDVLEHVPNPVSILRRCRDLMKDGGYLLLQVPNSDGISNRFKTLLCRMRIKRSEFKHFGFPWHLYSFNRRSLGVLLARAGLSPVFFESWSHLMKEGAGGTVATTIVSISKRWCLSDYITCLATRETREQRLLMCFYAR